MKDFKIINKNTWEITRIKSENINGAIRQFKTKENLKHFDPNVYELVEQNVKPKKKYQNLSFNQFEAKEFYNRKNK